MAIKEISNAIHAIHEVKLELYAEQINIIIPDIKENQGMSHLAVQLNS